MKPIYSKQNWEGTFTYTEGYNALMQYIEVDFKLEIVITNNSFVGTSMDSESKHLFDNPATVKGFIENKTISFIMKYPCSYYKNENGDIIKDESLEHPDIHYLGYLSDDKKQVSGNWEMTIYEEKHGEGYLEDILNGEFQMQRI